MDKLEEIYNELLDMGVLVMFGSYGMKGDCDSVVVHGNDMYGIFLDMVKIKTLVQEYEAVSHEWAHIKTGSLYAINAPVLVKRIAEERARRAQIKKIIPFQDLKSALENGITQPYELAEYFSVSEKMVVDAFNYYTGPCGLSFCGCHYAS